jgi:hypothetical protein
MSRRIILAMVVSAALVVGGAVYFVPKLFSDPDGPGIPKAVTRIEVKNGPAGSSYKVTKLSNPPAPTIPDARPLGQAVEITSTADPGSNTELHFHLNRSVLPKDEPGCQTPTTEINLGIAVFNERLQAWIPLPTTCTGDELVAYAPHFSKFWAFIVDAGKHVVNAVIHGVQTAVETVTTNTTSVIQYTTDLVKAVVVTFFRGLLGLFDDAKYVCSPTSDKYEVTYTAFSPALDACMVGGTTEELHFKNGLALPLAFDMTSGAEKYLTATPTGEAEDLFGMIESAVAASRGKTLVFGLEPGGFEVTGQASGKIQLAGDADPVSITIDLALAILTILVPLYRTASVALRTVMVEVNKRLIIVASRSGYKAISSTTIKTTIEAVVKENKNWAYYADHLLTAFGVADCLVTKPFKDPAAMTESALGCLGSVVGLAGAEFPAMLLAIAAQIKAVPELTQAELANTLKAGGLELAKITATITPKCPSNTVFQGMFQTALAASGKAPEMVRRPVKLNVVLCEDGWLYFTSSFYIPECNGYCAGVGNSFFHWVDGRWTLAVLGSTGKYVMPYDNSICDPLPPRIKSMTCVAA